MEAEIIAILSKIIKIPESELKKNREMENLWDSLSHVEVVFALEEKYGLEYTQEEIRMMRTIEKLAGVTERKVSEKAI